MSRRIAVLLTLVHFLLLSGCTTMQEAVWSGDIDTVRSKLDGGNDVNAQDPAGNTALFHAAQMGRIEIAGLLIDRGADVNRGNAVGDTPLSAAIWMAQPKTAELLIERGARIDPVNNQGNTPLLLAASKNPWAYRPQHLEAQTREAELKVVKLLINKGARIDARNNYEDAPIVIAAGNGRAEVVDLLIEKGADVNTFSKTGGTPLIQAAKGGHLGIVKRLIEKGANVDQLSPTGNTALTWAAAGGHTEVARLLIERGADLTVRNKAGKTSFDLANENKHAATYEMLAAAAGGGAAGGSGQRAVSPMASAEIKALVAKNDMTGLRRYLDQHPEALPAIEDEPLRLRYTGPAELRIIDVERLYKNKTGQALIVAQINSAGGPYKKFTVDELAALKRLGFADEVVAAMISVTTEYNKEQKRLVEQRRQSQVAALANPPAAPAQAPAQQAPETNAVAECVKQAAALKACDQAGGFTATACKVLARSQFKC